MSGASPFRDTVASEHRFGLRPLQSVLNPAVRFVGFWSAILLPFVVLGLLAGGAPQQSPLLFVGLLAANVVALVVGNGYKR